MSFPVPAFRARIALLSAAISGVVLLGFGAATWERLNHERIAALDREIRALAYRHPGWMNNQSNFERLGSAIEFIFGEDRKGRLIVTTLDASGNVRFQSAHWPRECDGALLDLSLADDPGAGLDSGSSPTAGPGFTGDESGGVGAVAAEDRNGKLARPPGMGPGRGPGGMGGGRRGGVAERLFTKRPRFMTVRTPTTTWRLGILGNVRDRLVLGLDGAEMEAELGRMRATFLIALPLALGLIGAGGWVVAGQAVRPLRRIADAAERVTARGLDQRLPASTEDPEIARLTGVLNRMMDRLEASFRQATRFSADASHELKTPLAVMQGELEQALQQAADGSRDQKVYASLLEETQRLKTITRRLLLLAQADSGQLPLSPEPVDLGVEVEALVADATLLADAAGLRLESAVAREAVVRVDRVLVRLAISNLLENAIHYNEAGGKVRVALATAEASVVLEVENTGPGIPAADQPRVFDRFQRGTEARQHRREGMGLGLSLAREILGAHGGALELVRSVPGSTVFRLTLPTRGSGTKGSRE